jgi:hypothetical protein
MLHLIETQRVYPPETLAAMTAVFDQLCESIPKSVDGDDPRRQLALIILRHVDRGLQEPKRPASDSLGRGLIRAQPQPYCGKLDECKVIGGEFVVTRRDPATLLDLVEEPLNQVAGTIEVGTEADGFVAIASRRNVGPNAPLGGKSSDPVSVISPVCQQYCSRLQAR